MCQVNSQISCILVWCESDKKKTQHGHEKIAERDKESNKIVSPYA